VPEGKAKLYGTLAQRQIEKAAKLTEVNSSYELCIYFASLTFIKGQ
jgi:hypothetical protein